MIDLHCHILPGIDDGAASLAESVEIARGAVRDDIVAIVATPHVRDDYPTTASTMERLVDEVRDALAGERIPIEVLRGGEVALDALMALEEPELRRFALGGAGRYLLVEFPYMGWPLPLPDQIERLHALGLGCVIAHPERSPDVQERPERLAPLVEAGALVQLTASSLDGRLGRRSHRCAIRLLDAHLAHAVASDAHGPLTRAVGMSGAASAVGDDALARWLTVEVPTAIVAGDDVPPRPRRRRRWGFGR
ncbi:MAG TPA: hypothetical protein PKD59_14975 [Miltoncostaeaceae bacterium]|nr:hypothetical protein [Miltoncostaeaceae bacterium]